MRTLCVWQGLRWTTVTELAATRIRAAVMTYRKDRRGLATVGLTTAVATTARIADSRTTPLHVARVGMPEAFRRRVAGAPERLAWHGGALLHVARVGVPEAFRRRAAGAPERPGALERLGAPIVTPETSQRRAIAWRLLVIVGLTTANVASARVADSRTTPLHAPRVRFLALLRRRAAGPSERPTGRAGGVGVATEASPGTGAAELTASVSCNN